MPLLDNEKAVKLTESVFNRYMRDKMQDKYKDFSVWQKEFKDNYVMLVKNHKGKWQYWTSYEQEDLTWESSFDTIKYS